MKKPKQAKFTRLSLAEAMIAAYKRDPGEYIRMRIMYGTRVALRIKDLSKKKRITQKEVKDLFDLIREEHEKALKSSPRMGFQPA